MESFLKWEVSFSCCKKATKRSSFYSLEKQLEMRKLAMNSWKIASEV
jgi:hypothetical protein